MGNALRWRTVNPDLTAGGYAPPMTAEATGESGSAERLEGLDALRGIAACVVAFGYHVKLFFAPGVFVPQWGGPIGVWMHEFGWTAVDLFFVLSGFVFAHVYLRTQGRLGSRGGQADFWVARLARLYPLHLAMLLVTAWLFRAEPANTAAAFAAHAVMLQAVFEPVSRTFVGPSWSLSVEVLCYAVFATAAWAGAQAVRTVGWIALGCGLTGIVMVGDVYEPSVAGYLSRGLTGFFAGQLLWHYRAALQRIATPALIAAVAAGIALSHAAGPRGTGAVPALSLLAWPALILLTLRVRFMTARPLVWLGDRSYAIYLLHMPMIDIVAFGVGGLSGDPVTILAAQFGLAVVTLGAADLVYRRFELPTRTAIRRAWLRRGAGAAAVGTV